MESLPIDIQNIIYNIRNQIIQEEIKKKKRMLENEYDEKYKKISCRHLRPFSLDMSTASVKFHFSLEFKHYCLKCGNIQTEIIKNKIWFCTNCKKSGYSVDGFCKETLLKLPSKNFTFNHV